MNHQKDIIKKQQFYDYGIEETLNFFSFITTMGQLQVVLEAKLGAAFGGHIKGGEGATVGVALQALAELTYEGILYQDGQLTNLEINDPLRAVFNEIHKIIGQPSENRQIGAKTLFSVLS